MTIWNAVWAWERKGSDMRKRPQRAPQSGVEALRKGVHTTEELKKALQQALGRGHTVMFLVPAVHLNRTDVKAAIQAESKSMLVPCDDPSLLGTALNWMQTHGGLRIFTSMYGELEELKM